LVIHDVVRHHANSLAITVARLTCAITSLASGNREFYVVTTIAQVTISCEF
jgi:hypothetical protein